MFTTLITPHNCANRQGMLSCPSRFSTWLLFDVTVKYYYYTDEFSISEVCLFVFER